MCSGKTKTFEDVSLRHNPSHLVTHLVGACVVLGILFAPVPSLFGEVVGVTASAHHIFSQFVDGVGSGGSYYQTTLMVTNPTGSSGACTFRLYGLTVNGQNAFTFNIAAGGWLINNSIHSTQSLKSGYAALQCSMTVEAQLLYSGYSRNGTKTSEATVFSSPLSHDVILPADHREGAKLGVAIANDSDSSLDLYIDAWDIGIEPAGSSGKITIAPHTNLANYIDNLIPSLPAGFYGQVEIWSDSGDFSAIGVRFTGNVFTTIPEIVGITSNTYHVFPAFADGAFGDGRHYRTTLMIENFYVGDGTCTLNLYGLTVNGKSVFTYSVGEGDVVIDSSLNSMQPLKLGYATLQCSIDVEAQLLYSSYSQDGTKLSEATVFSSPPRPLVEVLADHRENALLALAIVNDSDQSETFAITAYDTTGAKVGAANVTVDARTTRAAYLNDLIPSLPAAYAGPVLIATSTTNGSPSAVGLRYTGGDVFTTIPETQTAVPPGAGSITFTGSTLPVPSLIAPQDGAVIPQ